MPYQPPAGFAQTSSAPWLTPTTGQAPRRSAHPGNPGGLHRVDRPFLVWIGVILARAGSIDHGFLDLWFSRGRLGRFMMGAQGLEVLRSSIG